MDLPRATRELQRGVEASYGNRSTQGVVVLEDHHIHLTRLVRLGYHIGIGVTIAISER